MKSGEKAAFGWKRFVISCLIGGGAAVLVTLVILVGMAALVLGGMLDVSSSAVAADIAAAVGALVGGVISARRSGAGALPCGFVTAAVQLLVCALVGLIFYESFVPSEGGIALAASCFAGALVGALLGARRGGAKKVRRRRTKN